MRRFSTRFDAAVVSPSDAARVVEHASGIEKMAAAVKALAAARVADTELWKRDGDRSAAHHFARTMGVSVSQAQETLTTARRLADLPETTQAALAGKLSTQQAAVIADAAAADPEAEARLLEQAERASLGELRDEAARTKANSTDLEARRRRIHDRRYLREFTDAEGAGNLHLRDNPEVIAEMMAAIVPKRDELFNQARKEGRREPLEAYAADALVDVLRGIGSGSPTKSNRQAKILVRVDLPALLRGYPIDDETCELVGYGPVAVSALHDMMDNGDPFLVAIATKGKQVLGVAHLGRKFTAHQQSALEWLYPTCAVEGCNGVAFLENDHREDWARTRTTLLDYADRHCTHHHWLKTNEGWMLVEGTGKRAFVPPDDPRHPRHAQAPPSAAA